MRRFVQLDGVEHETRMEHFADASCAVLDFIIVDEGFVNYGGDVYTSGTTNINMERLEPQIIILSEAARTLINAACGTTFNLGELTDTSGINCPQYGLISVASCKMSYQIAAFTATTGLVLGTQSGTSACTLAGRPTDLDTANPLTALPQPLPSFVGVWAGDCIQPAWAQQAQMSFRLQLVLDPMAFHVKWTMYSGATCDATLALMMFYTNGMFFLGEPSTAVSGGYNVQFVTQNTQMLMLSQQSISYLQRNVFNGTACTYVQLNYSVPIDATNIHCPAFGFASITECPVLYDVMSQGTNYVTPFLQFGVMTSPQRLSACSPANRPTALGGMTMYNTIPTNTQSLLSAPVALAVILSFLIGGAIAGVIAGLCCRRCALNRGAKLTASQE